MTFRLQATAGFLLILLLGVISGPVRAADLKNTIRDLYGSQGILITSPLPFLPQTFRFQASSLQGLDSLNDQLNSAIGLPSFNSSVTGFAFDIERGIPVEITESLGPLLTERATTLGAKKLDLTFTYTRVNFTKLDGKPLDDLELVFLQQDVTGAFPFESDVIRAKLKVDLTLDIFALIASYGLTSRWDVGLVVPVTHIRLTAKSQAAIFSQNGHPGGTTVSGDPCHPEQVPTDCVHQFGPNSTPPNASGGGDETGLGDIILRSKYNFLRNYDDVVPDLAVLAEVKLPTGDEKQLLGTGGTNLSGLLVASKTYWRWFTPHLNLGYEIDTKDTRQNAIRYALGFDARLRSDLSLAGDVIGRFMHDESETGNHIVDLSVGVKWNPFKSFLLRANVQVPLDKNSGLRADFIPTVGFEYIF